MKEDKVDGYEQKYPWENRIKANPRTYGVIRFCNPDNKDILFSTSAEEMDKVKEWEDKMESEMFKGIGGRDNNF